MDPLEPMGRENNTSVTEFIFLGLSSNPAEQLILFGVFTAIYLVALMGNMLILLLVRLDSRLHKPMYFFLVNLSMVDIGYTSSTMPKMLANYLSQDKSISWAGQPGCHHCCRRRAIIFSSLLGTLASYVYITLAILRICMREGRLKAFSTCASHLTVVSLYFGTILFTYLRPNSTYLQEQDRSLPVLYGIVIPMLNPIIYSLRNKDVKRALRKALARS
ncbi:hypothetical protein UY3_14386 [Chelonia mydas]|uniref:G-protein coupled receptors family 1 profile domain-containing protein n=1 Tax=Chelonia mydas TaxID=8469 RepID=M7AUW0_CHEMY|nr:hypothetical protein UY3_14386 [Chelonia mydas]